MTHAYSELYLDDAMHNMGDMLDYAIVDCKYSADAFFSWFIVSGIAEKIENGNPKYIAGMSGVELAEAVIGEVFDSHLVQERVVKDFTGREYWAGWILAYFQWYRAVRFSELVENGLSLSEVMDLYILHEADVSKFVDIASERFEQRRASKLTKLAEIRKARGLSQQQLAQQSDVALRMIQLYEQRQNDIRKAQSDTLFRLARVLGCDMQKLME